MEFDRPERAVDKPEFSRPVSVEALGVGAQRFEIEATGAERAAMARRLGVAAVDRLAAVVTLERVGAGKVRLDADLEARLVQTCVVSLEPFPAEVEERFSLLYVDDGAAPGPEVAMGLEDELAEPLTGGVIDIGESVAQQLILAMDPYPRKPGAAPPAAAGSEGADETGRRDNPFAALAGLGKRR